MDDSAWMFHNYNTTEKEFLFIDIKPLKAKLIDVFTGNPIPVDGDTLMLSIPARNRLWVKKL